MKRRSLFIVAVLLAGLVGIEFTTAAPEGRAAAGPPAMPHPSIPPTASVLSSLGTGAASSAILAGPCIVTGALSPAGCGGGTPPAPCNLNVGSDGIDREYAGYASLGLSAPIPQIGHSASATIQLDSYADNSPGAVFGWVGVDDNEGVANHVQAGLQGSGSGVIWYVEYDAMGTNGDQTITGSATLGTNYSFSINHVGTREWSATVNGTTYGPWTFFPNHESTDTQFIQEDQTYNPSLECQSSFFYFQNAQPFATTIAPHMSIRSSPYYSVVNIANHYFDTISAGF